MAWKKGESGNARGRPKDKAFTEALRITLAEEDPKTQKRKLRAIADKLVDCALAGDPWAIKEVMDRVDGKAVQSVEVGAPGDFSDMSDAELESIIRSARSSEGTAAPTGRSQKPH